MKWSSGLTKEQLTRSKPPRDLSPIKVIGTEGRWLSYHTGLVTTSGDGQIIHMLA